MKKVIIFVLVIILVTSLICACGKKLEVIDKQPVDVRYTGAHTKLIPFTHIIRAGKSMIPITTNRIVNYPEKWEIEWVLLYEDNTESRKWIECTESEYLSVKEYLDGITDCSGYVY